MSKLKAQCEQEKAQMVQAHTREAQSAKERASSQLKQLEVEYGGRVAQVSEVGGESSRRVNYRLLPYLYATMAPLSSGHFGTYPIVLVREVSLYGGSTALVLDIPLHLL